FNESVPGKAGIGCLRRRVTSFNNHFSRGSGPLTRATGMPPATIASHKFAMRSGGQHLKNQRDPGWISTKDRSTRLARDKAAFAPATADASTAKTRPRLAWSG